MLGLSHVHCTVYMAQWVQAKSTLVLHHLSPQRISTSVHSITSIPPEDTPPRGMGLNPLRRSYSTRLAG